ncbi:MAG: OmpA family protein [Bacteriovoracia bacterium]
MGVFATFAVIMGTQACSHTPTVTEFPATASAVDETARLKKDLEEARLRQVNVLSPNHYADAQDALADAQAELKQPKSDQDSRDALHSVAMGRAYLDLATRTAAIGEKNLEPVLAARRQALTAKAPQYFEDDFRRVDGDLRDVGEDLEDRELQSAMDRRDELQAAFLDLELRALQEGAVGQAERLTEKARDEDARRFAPRTLAIAEKNIEDTRAYIFGNRHDQAGIERRATETLASAQHALKITREAKATNSTSPEDTALRLESERNRLESRNDQLALQQAATTHLMSENVALAKKAAADRRFEIARQAFSEDEAQVYRQGDTLTIRLRALQFPTNRATLKDRDFALLGKVQKVIKDFGETEVTVEGHTDSVGSKARNQTLSQQRAEAVRKYLVANNTLDTESVTAEGFGYDRPLASNKSAEGRAQNRRVDIVIQPGEE